MDEGSVRGQRGEEGHAEQQEGDDAQHTPGGQAETAHSHPDTQSGQAAAGLQTLCLLECDKIYFVKTMFTC